MAIVQGNSIWIGEKDGIYRFAPKTDEIIFRKFRSFSVRKETLEQCRSVILKLEHRNVVLTAEAEKIKSRGITTKQTNGQINYHLPMREWSFVEGDPAWLDKINEDYNLK